MNETGKQIVLRRENSLAVVGRQLDIADRLLKERELALQVDEFHVPADGTFEEAIKLVRPDGLISIAAGRYILEDGVTINKPLRIKGAGQDSTIIESSCSAIIICVNTEGSFAIENISILKSGEHLDDLVMILANNFNMKSCFLTGNSIDTISNNWWGGIRIKGRTTGTLEDSCVIRCRNGIIVEGDSELKLIRNYCKENDSNGIFFATSAEGIAEKNICSNNKGSGILGSYNSKVKLIGNRCEENELSGITFSKSASGTAEYNICANNKIGIWVRDHAKVYLDGNRCEKNDVAGIFFGDSATGSTQNNISRINKTSGIWIAGQAKVDLIGNLCEVNTSMGILLTGSATGLVKNNKCFQNKASGIQVSDLSEVQLIGNQCMENEFNGITCKDSVIVAVENNICSHNMFVGIWAIDKANGVYDMKI